MVGAQNFERKMVKGKEVAILRDQALGAQLEWNLPVFIHDHAERIQEAPEVGEIPWSDVRRTSSTMVRETLSS